MRILVVNDDGIQAEGIACLAEKAKEFGEVWVVAPAQQCSAMSHRITVKKKMLVKKVNFPVEGVKAYSVDGTPADCVKMAFNVIMPEKPDIVFSGINHGYNVGYDVCYSGTVGAAMDALLFDVPAIAFSAKMVNGMERMEGDFSVANKYLSMVIRGILEQETTLNHIWNVNFPGCEPDEVEGILWNRIPAQKEYYFDHFEVEDIDEGSCYAEGIHIQSCPDLPEGTDIHALNHNCISIGFLRSIVR